MKCSLLTMGRTSGGVRWAKRAGYGLLAYACGGYAAIQFVPGPGWCLLRPGQRLPLAVERSLCLALGVECDRAA